MKFTWSFKCWAVLLSCCLVAIPLYAQVQDTAQQQQSQNVQPLNSQTTQTPPPSQKYPPAQQTPPVQQYAPQVQQQSPVVQGNKSSSKEANFDEYLSGKMDGKSGAKGRPIWILAGLTGTYLCLCIGVAGIGLALMIPPSPPEQALMGRSSLYIQGYTEGYKSSIRWKNAGFATVGCAMAAVINMVIFLAMGYDPSKGYTQ